MNKHTRITLNTTFIDAVVIVSDGNPGALNALMNLTKESPKIDPESAWKEWGPLMSFDTYGIYGTGIHVLYKYVCTFSALKVLTLLRATQLGLLSLDEVKCAIETEQPTFDFDALLLKVQEVVNEFGR